MGNPEYGLRNTIYATVDVKRDHSQCFSRVTFQVCLEFGLVVNVLLYMY